MLVFPILLLFQLLFFIQVSIYILILQKKFYIQILRRTFHISA